MNGARYIVAEAACTCADFSEQIHMGCGCAALALMAAGLLSPVSAPSGLSNVLLCRPKDNKNPTSVMILVLHRCLALPLLCCRCKPLLPRQVQAGNAPAAPRSR